MRFILHGLDADEMERVFRLHAGGLAEPEPAFARLDHVSGDRFDLMWHRHTGQWLCFRAGVSLAEALRLMETEGLVQPT